MYWKNFLIQGFIVTSISTSTMASDVTPQEQIDFDRNIIKAEMMLEKKEYKKAIATYKTLLKSPVKKSKDFFLGYARVLKSDGDYKKAFEFYLKSLENSKSKEMKEYKKTINEVALALNSAVSDFYYEFVPMQYPGDDKDNYIKELLLSSDLDRDIKRDILLQCSSILYKQKRYKDSSIVMDVILEEGYKVDDDFRFFYARSLKRSNCGGEAYDIYNDYVKYTGREGKYYKEALKDMIELEENTKFNKSVLSNDHRIYHGIKYQFGEIEKRMGECKILERFTFPAIESESINSGAKFNYGYDMTPDHLKIMPYPENKELQTYTFTLNEPLDKAFPGEMSLIKIPAITLKVFDGKNNLTYKFKDVEIQAYITRFGTARIGKKHEEYAEDDPFIVTLLLNDSEKYTAIIEKNGGKDGYQEIIFDRANGIKNMRDY